MVADATACGRALEMELRVDPTAHLLSLLRVASDTAMRLVISPSQLVDLVLYLSSTPLADRKTSSWTGPIQDRLCTHVVRHDLKVGIRAAHQRHALSPACVAKTRGRFMFVCLRSIVLP